MIDVVMTCYNREKYLAQAIESVLSQTYKDFKLLIWDDGSVDSSVDIAHHYANMDNRVKVVAAPHQGYAKSIAQSTNSTKEKYFGWVDSDDWLEPTCLEKCLTVMEANLDAGYVYTQYWNVDKNEKVAGLGNRCQVDYSNELMLSWFITHHFRLIRRSAYDLIGGVNSSYPTANDYDLCLRLSEVAEVCQIKEPLYYYRRHGDSITKQANELQTTCSRQIISEAIERRSLNRLKL